MANKGNGTDSGNSNSGNSSGSGNGNDSGNSGRQIPQTTPSQRSTIQKGETSKRNRLEK